MFKRKSVWQTDIDFDLIRTRSRILVVDDQEFPYASLLRDQGYNLVERRDIDDIQAIETGSYDLVLLDMHGVGIAFSDRQGVGLLEHLKARNPAQIVIIYSAGTFGLDDQQVLSMADQALPKAAEFFEFKRCIDEHIARRFTPEFFIERALASIPSANESTRRALTKAVRRGRPEILKRSLPSALPEPGREQAIQIVQTAATIAQLIAQIAS